MHINGQGCPKCGGSKKLTLEEFIERSNIIHDFKYRYENVIYINHMTKVDIICPIHGIFKQNPNSHLIGQGCHSCNSFKSKSEKKIEKELCNRNINYKKQYYFQDLKHIKHLRFDFAIFDKNNNLLFLLEYNGEQHYKYVEYIHKDIKNFKDQEKRDKKKIEYCNIKNIKLIIIKYDEKLIERIDQILDQFFLFNSKMYLP
jgi:hypothetical protein